MTGEFFWIIVHVFKKRFKKIYTSLMLVRYMVCSAGKRRILGREAQSPPTELVRCITIKFDLRDVNFLHLFLQCTATARPSFLPFLSFIPFPPINSCLRLLGDSAASDSSSGALRFQISPALLRKFCNKISEKFSKSISGIAALGIFFLTEIFFHWKFLFTCGEADRSSGAKCSFFFRSLIDGSS